RQTQRQEVIAPKLEALYQWMNGEYPKVTPKSPIGKALSYSMKRWNELTVFLTDARLEIDNNKIENEIRPFALGRKNYLSGGTHESGQRIAVMYSLLACCRVNNFGPMGWLTHVL